MNAALGRFRRRKCDELRSVWGRRSEHDDRRSLQPLSPDDAGYVETQLVIESVLGELRDDHRRVIEIIVFQARSADEACAEVDGMTPDNAYQIVRRFRQRLRAALEGDNG